jgi:hypothetical protein
MSSSPHRTPAERPVEEASSGSVDDGDIPLLPIFAVIWMSCLARVVVGVVRHETFGTEPTLAFLVVLFLPWLVRGALRRLVSRK